MVCIVQVRSIRNLYSTLSVHTRKRSYLIEVGETAMRFTFRKVSRYAELALETSKGILTTGSTCKILHV